MSAYTYVAKDERGSVVSGIYTEVSGRRALRTELAKMGYVLVKARRKRKNIKKRGRIKREEVATFAFKFAGMYGAGLPIIKCLETLEHQTSNRALKGVIAGVKQDVATGSALADAFAEYREVFSDFFLGMIEAGEAGGKLAETLGITASYMEKQAQMRHKVKSAFAYPIIVTVMSLVVIAFLLAFVIPVFSKLYRQVHAPMPGPTLALVTLSSFIQNFWWAILIVAGALVLSVKRLVKNPRVKDKWDDVKLKMPVFGKLNRMLVVSHFTRTFAILSSVGVSIIKALDMASRVADNHRVAVITKELQRGIEAGAPIASSLKKYDLFPEVIVQMAASGEEVGVLPEMLNKGADLLDRDIDKAVSALMVKLEPAVTLTMGVVVAFILMGAYLPMFDYIGHLR